MHFTVTLNDQEIQGKFSVMRRRVTDLQPVMRDIGEGYLKGVEERFSSQTDPDGAPWKPLSKATLKRKKGPSILTEKHRLRGSIRYQESQSGVTIGTSGSIPYAGIHQVGGTVTAKSRSFVVHQKMYKGGKNKGRTLFAKASKADRAMKVGHNGYTITIPARPYLAANRGGGLDLGEKDRLRILQTLTAWLAKDGPLS